MRGYAVSPRVSPVCGGLDLLIDVIDTEKLEVQGLIMDKSWFTSEKLYLESSESDDINISVF